MQDPLLYLPYSRVIPYLIHLWSHSPLTTPVRGTFYLTRESANIFMLVDILTSWTPASKILIPLESLGSADKCCCVIKTPMSAMRVSRCPTFRFIDRRHLIRHHGEAFLDPRTRALAFLINQCYWLSFV